MATITQKITIDVARANVFSAIIGKQFDTDSRFLKCTLAQEGVAMEIESGVTVSINARRPDNTTSSFAGERNADGTVTVPIDEWILEQNGMVSLSVSIVSASGEKLTSCTFYLNVQQAEGEGWLWVFTATDVVATGTYHINFGGTDYEFTLPTALESGDKIYFSSALDYAKSVEPTGAEIDTMILTVGSGGTALVSSELINFLASLESELASYNSRVESVEDALDTKADKSGEFDDLTAGTANAVIDPNSYTPHNTPYLYRQSPSGKRCEYDVIGGTVGWNQLWNESKIPSDSVIYSSNTYTANGVTFTKNGDGSISVVTASGGATANTQIKIASTLTNSVGYLSFVHYIRASGGSADTAYINYGGTRNAYGEGNIFSPYTSGYNMWLTVPSGKVFTTPVKIYPQVINLPTLLGSTIADYAYQLEQTTAGSGIAWLKSFGFLTKSYYPYCEPTLESVQATARKAVGINIFDKDTMTVTDKYINDSNGNAITLVGSICTDFIEVKPNTAYYIKTDATSGKWGAWYDTDKNFISGIAGAEAKTAPTNARYIRFTINYKSSSGGSANTFCINISNPTINGQYFPYESHTYPLSEITLRGIPKLDSSNNIYYDGDVYKADGTITRRRKSIDLGTLTYRSGTPGIFYSNVLADTPEFNESTLDPKVINTKYLYSSSAYGSLINDKVFCINGGRIWIVDTAYSDVAIFKSAMSGVMFEYPLATPTTESTDSFTPIQYTGSTESFSTDNDVPVGVEGKYYTDLTLPKLPTANGTYTLKCTVTDGTGIVSWVSE